MRKSAAPFNRASAEAIGLKALAFLASEPARINRFLSLTGLDGSELRTSAGSAETLAAVLEFVLQDESMLLEFATNAAIPPTSIAPAHAVLAGGDAWP